MSADEIVRKLHLHYTGGEGMVAALQTNLALARSFDDKVLVVPEGDFQRDLLLDILSSNPQTRTFQDEVLQAARDIARKYHGTKAACRTRGRLCPAAFPRAAGSAWLG